MHLRLAVVTLWVTIGLSPAAPALAVSASPVVRIEGDTQTLFEGPVRTDGHAIRAASDTTARVCDGTNAGRLPASGPTPTTAAVDAMSIAGRDFDARWDAGFDDYFVTRLGPDAENGDRGAYWGLLVDEAFTSVGGCQVRVDDGSRVLWAADAFTGRAFLTLAAVGQTGTTVAVAAGADLVVRATQKDAGEGDPGTTAPAVGAQVAPVQTAMGTGFQTVVTSDLATKDTDADGQATFSWLTPGWKRIKATRPDATTGGGTDGFEDAVRSNRLDVCVGDCGPAPADVTVRQAPPPTPSPEPGASPAPGPGSGAGTTVVTPAPTVAPVGRVRISGPRFSTGADARGRVRVGFTVQDAGPGIRGWTLESRTLPGTRFRRRATGTSASGADLRLPAGRTSEVRFTLTDAAGRTSRTVVGKVVVPLDDQAGAFKRRGAWKAGTRIAGAWKRTVTVGGPGARASVRLAAGRPRIFFAKGTDATVAVRAGARVQRFRVRGRATVGATGRTRAGTVRVRVVQGKARLDGAAVAP